MADNTDEEHLNIPTNNQSENRSDEIIPTTDTGYITQNQEIENMEVHHHPNLHHKTKKWKEYFLEFLMIFLAVTMGFFAESLRENIGNRETVRKNMETILSNLKSDSANLHNLIEFNNSRVKALDSLDRFRYQNLTDTSVLKNFLPHINSAIIFSFFTISKVGVDQMKSSNGFRLIKQRNVVDSIFAYYDFNSVLDENSDYINYFQRQVFNLYHKLFEPNNLNETSSILGRNRGSVIEFFNTIATMNLGLNRYYTKHLNLQLQNSIRLINLLEQTYYIK